MTTGEARVLETEAVIFSKEPEQSVQKSVSVTVEETSSQIKLVEETNRINIETRFARLKKSLRKRSVSIL